MFLDLIRRRNPRLIEAAIALHQSGQLPANTYVIDLDAVEDNARAIARRAEPLGLTVMAMTKQMGRNESFCHAVMRGGIARSVAVDLECALATKRAGMEVGHIGHLVQIPKWEADSAARLSPAWWTVFNAEKAAEAAAASREVRTEAAAPRPHPRRERSILPRARGRVSRVRNRCDGGGSGQDSGRPLRWHNDLSGVAVRRDEPHGQADAKSRDSATGVRGAGARRTQGDRDQRSGHDLDRDPGSACGSRRDPGRARTRAHRNDAVACERRPARGASRCLSDGGLAPLWRRCLLLRRRSLHRPGLSCLPGESDRRPGARDGRGSAP